MSTTEHRPLEVGRILCRRLEPIFGLRLRGLVLYGSRARGDARPDSDFDFLVLLDRVERLGAEISRISSVTSDLCLDRDIVVFALPVAESDFASSRLPFYRNARREGVVLGREGDVQAPVPEPLPRRPGKRHADEVSSEARFLLNKGKRSLDASRVLLAGGYTGCAMSRAYYAGLYAAQALLLERDLSFPSDSAVVAAFGRCARESELPAGLDRVLRGALRARNRADYGEGTDPDSMEAEQLIQPIAGLVETVELHLQALGI